MQQGGRHAGHLALLFLEHASHLPLVYMPLQQ